MKPEDNVSTVGGTIENATPLKWYSNNLNFSKFF